MRRREVGELLDAAAGASGGVLTRAQLLRAGLSSAGIYRCCASGELVPLQRGVFRRGVAGGLSAVAAAVAATDGAASHDSAALVWQLDLVHHPAAVHVIVARSRSRASVSGGTVHRVDLPTTDVEERSGIRVTTALRTVLDCARVLSLTAAVVVADSALRSGLVSLEDLSAAAAAARGTGSARVRRAVALADPASASPLGSVMRVELTLGGLAPSHSQYVVRDPDGRVVGIADFCYLMARLLIEADGFAFHSSRAVVRRDRRKTNGYALAGWRLLRFSWEDVLHDPQYVLETVAAELARPLGSVA